MTDQTAGGPRTTDTPTDDGVSTATDTPSEGGTQEAEAESPNREAARYRTQLRDTEAARDRYADQLQAARRQIVEGASGLLKPAALWAAGVNVDELFGDDGAMDPEKVQALVAEKTDLLGLAKAKRFPRPDPSQGRGISSSNVETSWSDLLRRD